MVARVVITRDLQVGAVGRPVGDRLVLDSDRFSFASRIFVRYGWRLLQRHVNFASTTPAKDYELRANHDHATFEWARSRPEKPVLIAGHTHHPVFDGTTPPWPAFRPVEAVEHELEALHGQTGRPRRPRRAAGRAEGDLTALHYNTGCCSFGDGDVTGIEIADGKIRLVRWLDDDGKPKIKLLAEDDLRTVVRAVGATS